MIWSSISCSFPCSCAAHAAVPRQYEDPLISGKGGKHRMDCAFKMNITKIFVHHFAKGRGLHPHRNSAP
ncbi:exported hypothetical protein [Mesorhizobium metallidurans STM 2683]|uniref:Uncharacterized protein n=1 Tax=Mesorhizobium metallidurans STM 2683 TaxID=1297569 RepID=M5ELC7_9HYPH|nr:exported hypothetical protein [Mesorhizobium metallidurans STM 2683]